MRFGIQARHAQHGADGPLAGSQDGAQQQELCSFPNTGTKQGSKGKEERSETGRQQARSVEEPSSA